MMGTLNSQQEKKKKKPLQTKSVENGRYRAQASSGSAQVQWSHPFIPPFFSISLNSRGQARSTEA
jgi:hypothetical protein